MNEQFFIFMPFWVNMLNTGAVEDRNPAEAKMRQSTHPRAPFGRCAVAIPVVSMVCLVTPVIALGAVSGENLVVVNEPGGLGFDQQDPVLSETASGALLGFLDDRSGVLEYRIRAFDVVSGTLSPSAELAPQEFPLRCSELKLGSNLSGDSVALWKVDGIPGRRIARLDPSTGERVGESATILHDEPDGGSIEEVTIEVMPDGSNLVFFMSDTRFKARIFSSRFQPFGPSFLIEDNTGGNYVDTAFHDNGTFTLAWTGINEPYFSTVRAQRFNPDGTPAGELRDLTTDADKVFIDTPAIAGRPDGRAVVSWLKNDFVPVIFGQFLDVDGLPVGQPRALVSGDSIFGDPRHLFAKDDGSWALIQQREQGEWASTVQVFDEDLSATDTVLTVDGTLKNQSIWLSGTEDVLMVWESPDESPRKDIRGTMVPTSSGSVGEVLTLSDDPDGADQVQPVVAADPDGNLVVAWLDARFGDLEIYCQRYDQQGRPVGMNFPVPGASPVSGGHLGVSMNADGGFIVSWTEAFEDRSELNAQRFDSESRSLGGLMKITSDEGVALYEDCLVKFLEDGRVLASWNRFDFMSSGSRELDLYQRLYSEAGMPLTIRGVRVDIESPDIRAHQPLDATIASTGDVLLHYAFGGPDPKHAGSRVSSIAVRTIGFDGMPMGTERLLFTVPHLFEQISLDALGEKYAVAWTTAARDVVSFQAGILGSDEIQRNVINGEGALGDPNVIRTGSGSCFVVWSESEWQGGIRYADIKALRHDLLNEPVGESVEFFRTEGISAPVPSMAVASDRIVGVYQSWTLTDQGLDVFKAVDDFVPCLAPDYNCDGRVDGLDLSRLLASWGMPETDLDGDADTNGKDLLLLLGAWTG